MMGINSSGLSVCINALFNNETRVGVPLLAIVREVMNQKSIDDAMREIERATRPYSLNFVIGTPEGIVDAETYPDTILKHDSNDVIWHTNHCIYSDGFQHENAEYRSSSVARCDRMKSLLESERGKLELNVLQKFLRDHSNRPHSICLHVDSSKSVPKQSRTLDGMIYVPEKREAWIAKGNPCESTFVQYTV
jgi:isopenicillin-N N-acyltransferase-like protein